MEPIMSEAPPFDPDRPRTDYPLSGAKTGPAWRAAWTALRSVEDPKKFVPAKEIVERVHQETNVNPSTIRNLLIGAERAGILDRSVRLHEGRNWTHYRIRAEYR